MVVGNPILFHQNGFLIDTSDAGIVYTGDFRMHGTASNLTDDFIRKAQEAEPDIMIVEGTHINYSQIASEDEVKYKLEKLVSKTDGLVLARFAAADIDRIRTFIDVAKVQGMVLAISMKQAFMLHILKDDPDLNLFMLDDPNVRIYKKEKRTTRAYEQAIESEYSNIVVDAEEINRTQGETIMVASLYDMSEMTTIRPRPDSIYILSQTEAFNEEMEISQEKLQNWLDHYGIPLYHTHASGHAGPHELKGMLEEVQPEIVYPVHTSHPELFKKFMADTGIEIRIPRCSEPEAVGAMI